MVAISAGKVEDMVDLQNKLSQLTLLADPDLATINTWGLRPDPGAEEGNPATFVITRDGKVAYRRLESNGKDWPTYDELAAALK